MSKENDTTGSKSLPCLSLLVPIGLAGNHQLFFSQFSDLHGQAEYFQMVYPPIYYAAMWHFSQLNFFKAARV